MAISTKLAVLVFALWALHYLCRRLQLGRPAIIASHDQARQIADEQLYGFAGTEVAIAPGGRSALVKGAGRSYAVIRSHGAHFVVRQTSSEALLHPPQATTKRCISAKTD
jgi:hypothetical protein